MSKFLIRESILHLKTKTVVNCGNLKAKILPTFCVAQNSFIFFQ